ncbi:MAG: hypothetical protein QM764_22275 [Chitinophagaceae bacterium]
MIRNIQFTLLVKINKKLHEFNFRKRSNELYDVDGGDERGNRFYFKMQRNESSWKINDTNLPAWIHENENAIAEALTQKETGE